MAYEFRLPDLGEGMEEATIVKWLVKPGDVVRKDQNIVEVETDKAVVDIPSPYEGKVISLKFKVGDVAKVGSVLLTIGSGGEKHEEVIEGNIKPATQRPVEVLATPRVKALARELGVDLKLIKGSGMHGEIGEQDVRMAASKRKGEVREIEKTEAGRLVEKRIAPPASVKAVPQVRELAKKLGIDLSKIMGSGPDGAITVKDVEDTANTLESIAELGKIERGRKTEDITQKISHPLKEVHAKYIEERIPVKGVRKAIIEKLTKSNSFAVQTTAMDEFDVTKLVEVREKEKLNAKSKNVHLTYLPFIIKACVIALKRNPWLNATFDDESNEFVLKRYYNIGVAVDTNDGLLVPVIKDVELKSIMNIAREIEMLAEGARNRKLTLDQLTGGTFTITNWGSIGGGFGTPILNYPECAILGIGRMEKKPVVVGERVEIRTMLPISLTFDHRIVDGAQAARFITDLKKHLEDPALLLVDIV